VAPERAFQVATNLACGARTSSRSSRPFNGDLGLSQSVATIGNAVFVDGILAVILRSVRHLTYRAPHPGFSEYLSSAAMTAFNGSHVSARRFTDTRLSDGVRVELGSKSPMSSGNTRTLARRISADAPQCIAAM